VLQLVLEKGEGALQPGVEVVTGPSRVLRTLKEGDAVQRQQLKPGEKAGEKK